MANLEDHEERIKVLEKAFMELRVDMVKMMMRYSFLGSLSATLVVAIPALVYWWIQKA